MTRLTAERVRVALEESRATSFDGANNIQVTALGMTCTFNLSLLEARRGEIQSMIDELDSRFRRGGGWSFLNLPMDKHGHQWGEQPDALALLLMAKALGLGFTFDLGGRRFSPHVVFR